MKITHYITIILAFAFSIGVTGQDNGNSIELTITNIKSDDGHLLIGLYNTSENFLKKPYKSKKVKAVKGIIQVSITDIPNGEYGVSLFHDEDDNSELNTNFFGIPKEAYGCSNNAKGSFGPPAWDDAKFIIDDQVITQSIKL